METLSEAQKQTARRCATVALECEKLEARAVFGEQIDLDTHGQMIDRFVRAFQRFGIKRISRDAMPTLDEYLAAQAQDVEEEPDDATTSAQHGNIVARIAVWVTLAAVVGIVANLL